MRNDGKAVPFRVPMLVPFRGGRKLLKSLRCSVVPFVPFVCGGGGSSLAFICENPRRWSRPFLQDKGECVPFYKSVSTTGNGRNGTLLLIRRPGSLHVNQVP
jgi:hypothetical protein